MKMNIRRIALLVALVLVAVFAYQSWWLLRLYRNETRLLRQRIQQAVVQADYLEMDLRIRDFSANADHHGTVSIGAWAKYDDADTSYVETMTRKDLGDSTYIQLSRQKMTEEERQKMKEHPVKEYFRDLRNDSLLTKENPMLGMSYTVQRNLHVALQDMSAPNLERYDSLLTALLADCGLETPHLIEAISDDDTPTDSLSTTGYTPSAKAERFTYYTSPNTFAAYRLTVEPVRSTVLRQMAGILSASLVILAVLGFVFVYLIRTLMRLRTLDEMKTDFTNNMTHELKTPISVAYAANDALLNFDTLSPKAEKYLRISQEQLRRLSGMVEQILSMSMERRRTLTLHITDVRVEEVVKPLVDMFQLKSGQQPVSLTIDIAPADLQLRADRNHLSAMLSNLIDNAIKYSDGKEAVVTIRCRENCIEVSDEGIGIPQDKLRYVCDRFYRVPQGDRHDVKGYGLGLYYVKSMMERHGGSLQIESKEGKGTTVTLRFNG